MMEIQQKVSGGLRTQTGATNFCRMRSCLSTLQKNHVGLFDGIIQALAAQPWLPPEQPPIALMLEASKSGRLEFAARVVAKEF